MNSLSTDSLRWAQREKGRHQVLIGGAVLLSALIAFAPHNERRMFTLPEWPAAYAAVPAPEPTSLRSAIMGYLTDGCVPTLHSTSDGFMQLVNKNDCGPARERRQAGSPIVQKPAPLVAPSAFFAAPQDLPNGPDGSPMLIPQLALAPQELAFTPPPVPGPGPGGFFSGIPVPLPGFIPPVLAAVPEPSTWALMIGGFGLTGLALRRRRVRVGFTVA